MTSHLLKQTCLTSCYAFICILLLTDSCYVQTVKKRALIFDAVFFSGVALAASGAALLIVDILKKRSPEQEVSNEDNDGDDSEKVSLVPSLLLNSDSFSVGLAGQF